MKKSILIPIMIFFTSCLITSFSTLKENSFQIGTNEWKLTSAIIANESYGTKSKFEIDIMSDNNTISKAKTFIYFSVTSSTSISLTDGSYAFSTLSPDSRSPFHFDGTVKINGQKVKITNGTFSIENQAGLHKIHFILKLENGDVANGSYFGKTSLVDRSSNYR